MSERNPLSIVTNLPPRNLQSDAQQNSASNSSVKSTSQSQSTPCSPAKSPRKKKAKTDKSVFIASHFDSNNQCLAPVFTWQNSEWAQSRCDTVIQSISHRKDHLILKHPIVKRHLYEELDEKRANDDDEQRESQPTSKHKPIKPSTIPLNEAQALAWADCSLPYNIMIRESFQTFLESYRLNKEAALTRKEIPIEQQKLALAKRAKIMQVLAARSKFRPVTIATDGWTDVNGAHVTNILLLSGGCVIYWKSIYTTSSSSDDALPYFRQVIDELLANKVWMAGFVTDNGSPMLSLYDKLKPHYKFLHQVRCSCHSLQLIVTSLIKLPEIAERMRWVKSIGNLYRSSTFFKNQLDTSQIASGFEALLTPVQVGDTRWNSLLYAINRLIKMKDAILQLYTPKVLAQIKKQKLNSFVEPARGIDACFIDLEEIRSFLQPFQLATDIFQSNNCSLLEVRIQMDQLKEKLDHLGQDTKKSALQTKLVNQALESYSFHRKEKFKQSDLLISDWLSLEEPESVIRRSKVRDIGQAREDFIAWCHNYYVEQLKCQKADQDLIDLAEQEAKLAGDKLSKACSRSEAPWAGLAFSKHKQIEMLVNEKASASNQRPLQSPDATRIFFEPIRCWEELLLSEPQFARCAAAYLSLAASEAAVERAFSLQKLTHSIIRNRLSEKSVENEMFLKMYHRTFGHAESISIVDQTWKLGAWIEFDDDAVDDNDENERLDEDQSIESIIEEENLMRDNDDV